MKTRSEIDKGRRGIAREKMGGEETGIRFRRGDAVENISDDRS
jgi:hypothetical protein